MALRQTLSRLYRGETNVDFIAKRKIFYLVSAVLLLICIASIVFRSFNMGVEFAGGNQFRVQAAADTSLVDVRTAVERTGIEVSSAQVAGSGSTKAYVIRTAVLNPTQTNAVKQALATADRTNVDAITTDEVSSSWGRDVTTKAIQALVVFLIAVSLFIWIRFREIRMALAAVLALLHDLLLTAGVYSIIGFEVTPGTVIGLLTILGYSLYDTVVVFDKVNENTGSILGSVRYTYGEQANRAVNQTLMRSINTSLIGLLPVAGLLFVGAGLLGVGTLKDLALVLFVGMITGAYSSLFLATPWAVDFKMTDARYKNHATRVLSRRAALVNQAAKGTAPGKGKGQGPGRNGSVGDTTTGPRAAAPEADGSDADVDTTDDVQSRVDALSSSPGPRVGARPSAGKRPNQRPGRPGGGKKRR